MMEIPCVVLKVQRKFKYSSLAQLVERAAVNRVVAGSSPAGGAKKTRRTMDSAGLVLFRTKISLKKKKHSCIIIIYFSQEDVTFSQSGKRFVKGGLHRKHTLL